MGGPYRSARANTRRFEFADYPEELAKPHRRRYFIDTEVINAGSFGYYSSHGLCQLHDQILDLGPDILTIRVGYDDHTPSEPLE